MVLEPETGTALTGSRTAPWRARLRIGLERSQRLLCEPWVQRAILVAVIVWVFWDGIWAGVARSDQIYYLHHIAQFDSLWDILSHSPSWNRTTPDPYPDFLLYRPVLYLLMGTFYYLFRYNFVAWQSAGLTLHVAVALGLHLLLLQGSLKRTVFPLLISLLFATGFLASELVFWNHIVGYLLFCALEVYAIYFFVRFVQTDRVALLIPCGALSLIAEFTYESGALVNLLFAATLFARSFLPAATQACPTRTPRSDRWSALLFLLAALLLPLASAIDIQYRSVALVLGGPSIGTDMRLLLEAAEDSVLQIAYWLSTWLAPTVYHCTAFHRMVCGVSSVGLTFLRLLNLVALALLALGGIAAFRRLRRSGGMPRASLLALAASAVFLLGYSMIIAIGRTVPKGLLYVLQVNVYYCYMALLAVCVGIAVAAAVGRSRTAPSGSEPPAGAADPNAGRRLLPALALLAIANGCAVHELARSYRYDYAPPRQEVIDRVLAWRKHSGSATPRYFTVSPTCRGNDLIVWLDEPKMRRNSGWKAPVTLADALFPEQSADLNAANTYISKRSVDEIRCGDSAAVH